MSQQPISDQDGVQALVFGASGVVRKAPSFTSLPASQRQLRLFGRTTRYLIEMNYW